MTEVQIGPDARDGVVEADITRLDRPGLKRLSEAAVQKPDILTQVADDLFERYPEFTHPTEAGDDVLVFPKASSELSQGTMTRVIRTAPDADGKRGFIFESADSSAPGVTLAVHGSECRVRTYYDYQRKLFGQPAEAIPAVLRGLSSVTRHITEAAGERERRREARQREFAQREGLVMARLAAEELGLQNR